MIAWLAYAKATARDRHAARVRGRRAGDQSRGVIRVLKAGRDVG